MAPDRTLTLLAAAEAAVADPDPVSAAWVAGLAYRRVSHLERIAAGEEGPEGFGAWPRGEAAAPAESILRPPSSPSPSITGLTTLPGREFGPGSELSRLLAKALEAQGESVRAREAVARREAMVLDAAARSPQAAAAAIRAVMNAPAAARLPNSAPGSVRLLAVPAGVEPALSYRFAWYAAARLDQVTAADWRPHLEAAQSGPGAADRIPREAVEAARDWHAGQQSPFSNR